MIDLKQIRELDLETVEPGHFVELGNEVVQALRAELGDEALKSIYDTARGEGPDGFGERFAEALERYTDLHGELFDITEAAAGESDSLQDQGDDFLYVYAFLDFHTPSYHCCSLTQFLKSS